MIAARPSDGAGARYPAISRIIVPGMDVVRDGREESFLATRPTLSSVPVEWGGIALENYMAAGISRVKGIKQLGFRCGNWLSAEQSSEVLKSACGDTVRAKRDYAMLAMLFGCGFRRSELVGSDLDDIQMRQGHSAVVDLIGKGGHIRTVPIPN